MAKCQACGTKLDGDFGVVSCSKCGEVNFVDSSADNVESPEQSTSTPHPTTSGTELAYTSDLFESEALENVEAPLETNEPSLPIHTPQVDTEMPLQTEVLEGLSTSEKVEQEQNPFEDVINYANSDSSQAEDGVILYDINISTVDSINQSQEIKKVLSHPLLALDLQQIKAQIEKGRVEIFNLNPAKASHIVSNLKGLGLELEWKQKTLLNNEE